MTQEPQEQQDRQPQQRTLLLDGEEKHHQKQKVVITTLPPTVTNLLECARYQLEYLQGKIRQDEDCHTNNDDDEDALDDGFMICDVNVITNKLKAWNEMFPRVKPYFAVKCNPDPCVARVLGQSSLGQGAGFDCASLSEVRLAASAMSSSTTTLDDEGSDKNNISSSSNNNHSSCGETLDWTRIIYANPQRAEHDLETALSMGVTAMTFDGVEELDKIYAACQKQQQKQQQTQTQSQSQESKSTTTSTTNTRATTTNNNLQLILRILVPDEHSNVPLGEKFGTPPHQIAALARHAKSLFGGSGGCDTGGDEKKENEKKEEITNSTTPVAWNGGGGGGGPGGPIIGISFHCGSGCHDPKSYMTALKLARDAMDIVNEVQNEHQPHHDQEQRYQQEEGQPSCWLLDMGGGYPGWDGLGGDQGRFSGQPTTIPSLSTVMTLPEEEEEESTLQIAKAVNPLLDEWFPVSSTNDETMKEHQQQSIPSSSSYSSMSIISEPGRYFVEAAFGLVSRIYKVRVEEKPITTSTGSKDETTASTTCRYHYTIGHGVQGVFKDVLLCGESFPPIPLSMSTASTPYSNNSLQNSAALAPTTTTTYPSTVHGPSGEELDVICADCQLPLLTVNDYLVFDRMGAYTLSIASRTGRPVIRYVQGGGGVGEGF